MTSWTFFCAGRPRTKGSVHAFRAKNGAIVRKDSNPKTKAWAGVVSHAAQQAGVRVQEGPVVLELEFYFLRPVSHYGTGRNAGTLKDGAPARPTGRNLGDLDKLERAVLDALSGVAFRDDSQVVDVRSLKWWVEIGEGNPEGVRVHVAPAQVRDRDPAVERALDLEGALLDLLAWAQRRSEEPIGRVPLELGDARAQALALLDEIGDARCQAGSCGHEEDEGCRAARVGEEALTVGERNPGLVVS